jgi:hypothetical protein
VADGDHDENRDLNMDIQSRQKLDELEQMALDVLEDI